MKSVKARVTGALPVGAILNCADNSGAKMLQIISVHGYKGRRRKKGAAGVGDLIKCSAVQGDVKIRKQIVDAVIIRQRGEYRRYDGMRVSFDDNAAVLVNEKNEPRGTQIKGPVAKEAVERFSGIGKISRTVV